MHAENTFGLIIPFCLISTRQYSNRLLTKYRLPECTSQLHHGHRIILQTSSILSRYFDCTNKFGVFAPLGKVSKSPVQGTGHAGKNCAVHPDKDIPIVSTIVKEVKPAPGSRPFMDKTTTTVYEKKAPRGVQPVTQVSSFLKLN